MNTSAVKPQKIRLYILIFSLFFLLSAAGLISYFAIVEFERVLVPELEKKAEELGKSVNSVLAQTLAYGIPLTKFNGVAAYFDTILHEHPETEYLVLTDPEGKILYHSSAFPDDDPKLRPYFSAQDRHQDGGLVQVGAYYDLSTPLVHAGRTVAVLHLGLRGELLLKQVKEIGYDILTVLLISFLLAFELLLLTFSYFINGPLDSLLARLDTLSGGRFVAQLKVKSEVEFGKIQNMLNQVISTVAERFYQVKEQYVQLHRRNAVSPDLAADFQKIERDFEIAQPEALRQVEYQRAIDVRGLWFLFIFSAMIPASFLPMYIGQLYVPIEGLSKSVVISSPLSIYYFFTFIGIAFAGVWSEKVGRRTAMVTGALLNFAGYVGAGFAVNIFDLTLYYSTAALGFGFVMIAAQGYVIDNSPASQRASTLALFWAGFFAGTLCGNGIGGILADRIGYRITFELAAAISLLSALLMWKLLLCKRDTHTTHRPEIKFTYLKTLLANPRFLVVVFGLSMPAKICMTGFIFYFVPLYLFSLDITQSNIGRVLMIYSLMFIFVGPYISRFFERRAKPLPFTLSSTLLAGGALLAGAWIGDLQGILLGVALYALFRSSCTSTTTALALQVCETETRQLGSATVVAVAVLFERIGNITGPLLSGAMIASFGYGEAMVGYGLLTMAGALLVFIVFGLYAVFHKNRGLEATEAA